MMRTTKWRQCWIKNGANKRHNKYDSTNHERERERLTDRILNGERKNKPSLRIAIISTMKGGKSNFHMRASNMKPICQHIKWSDEWGILNTQHKKIIIIIKRKGSIYKDKVIKPRNNSLTTIRIVMETAYICQYREQIWLSIAPFMWR